MIPTKEEEVDKIEEFSDRLANIVLDAGGSVSGEHGVGLGKARYVEREFGMTGIKVMQQVKQALDPRGIMNPGKSFYMRSRL
ncbi:d-lactate dehydrogenase, putative [Perkinsus marinus ATCC 50983]|nr:d-lactate dehydrogenase, putative [Perkinsus marinus ATCC 50983]EER08355.1 d-lactate dehydrogenase, putative [Perkinsus marinus ATCC 50983]|eukprot:XP_002776539.1 d-lactate dehydrogenase, putative [Perkinsus marinus ATCC 50983]